MLSRLPRRRKPPSGPETSGPETAGPETSAGETSAGEMGPTLQARREAAWLAALATDLARFSHDLRGILSPALLGAERIQAHPDPAVRRSAEVTIRAIDRALDLLREQVGAVRAGLPTGELAPVPLRSVIDAAGRPDFTLRHAVPETIAVWSDAERLRHGLASLLAELRQGGATHAAVEVEVVQSHVVLTFAHDGPERADAKADLVAATEQAIARDFLRACGAELLTPQATTVMVRLQRA